MLSLSGTTLPWSFSTQLSSLTRITSHKSIEYSLTIAEDCMFIGDSKTCTYNLLSIPQCTTDGIWILRILWFTIGLLSITAVFALIYPDKSDVLLLIISIITVVATTTSVALWQIHCHSILRHNDNTLSHRLGSGWILALVASVLSVPLFFITVVIKSGMKPYERIDEQDIDDYDDEETEDWNVL